MPGVKCTGLNRPTPEYLAAMIAGHARGLKPSTTVREADVEHFLSALAVTAAELMRDGYCLHLPSIGTLRPTLTSKDSGMKVFFSASKALTDQESTRVAKQAEARSHPNPFAKHIAKGFTEASKTERKELANLSPSERFDQVKVGYTPMTPEQRQNAKDMQVEARATAMKMLLNRFDTPSAKPVAKKGKSPEGKQVRSHVNTVEGGKEKKGKRAGEGVDVDLTDLAEEQARKSIKEAKVARQRATQSSPTTGARTRSGRK